MVAFIKSVAVLAFAALAVAAPSSGFAKRGDHEHEHEHEVQQQTCGSNKVVSCCNNEKETFDGSKSFIELLEVGDLVSGAQCTSLAANPGVAVLGAAVPIQNHQDQKCSSSIACCQEGEGDEVNGLVPINADVECNIVKVL